jgi:type IV pilus assembly protein PilW
MTHISMHRVSTGCHARPQSGFTLVELMIAMAIGLIASIGIVTLFSGTSRSNQLQEGLARLQENGRYATLRIEDDLRRVGTQFCSTTSGNRQIGSAAPLWQDRVPWIFAPNLNLPDSGGMQSVNPADGLRSTSAATAPYALSTRFSMQGYSCTTGTACTPALPNPGMFPAAGLTAGSRVPNSDILTIRYLRGSGWPIDGTGNCNSGGTVNLAPLAGDAPVNLATGDLALVTDCQSPYVVRVAGVSGNTFTVGTNLGSGTLNCRALASRDVRVFNFSRDFVTITYYLAFRANDNPDASQNVPGASLVPVLVRRENGVEQDIVRGVDNLVFRYGVRDRGGNMRFLTAQQVHTGTSPAVTCPPKPDGVAPSPGSPGVSEPNCLWRSVRRIEASLLVNSGDEVPSLDDIGRSFRFMGTSYSLALNDPLASGLQARSFPRREFIAHATHRNKTP